MGDPLPPPTASSSYTAPPPRNRVVEKSTEALERERLILPHPERSAEALERERLILPRLPPVQPVYRPVHDFIYKLVLASLYLVYSVYLKLRWTYHTALNRGFSILYYHHRTPQLIQQDVKEVKAKGKLPKHLSVILEYEKGGLDTLIDEVAEITCWCASAGIKHLSVYEQTGIITSHTSPTHPLSEYPPCPSTHPPCPSTPQLIIPPPLGVLKSYISPSHRSISQRLHSYFGKSRPTFRVHSPPSGSFTTTDMSDEERRSGTHVDIEVVFISEEDGRESLVDLTKTLCDMAQRGKIMSEDVSIELIDAEVKENVIPDPDLLILFSPNITLRGYPPWQIRLTEIL